MYTLSYESDAATGTTDTHIGDILDSSRTNNAKSGITGCLVHCSERFFQILEGEKEDVLELYKRIKTDLRHNHVELLSRDDIEKTVFTGWNMAFCSLDRSPEGLRELKHFRKNMLLLADLTEGTSKPETMFWRRIQLRLSVDTK